MFNFQILWISSQGAFIVHYQCFFIVGVLCFNWKAFSLQGIFFFLIQTLTKVISLMALTGLPTTEQYLFTTDKGNSVVV